MLCIVWVVWGAVALNIPAWYCTTIAPLKPYLGLRGAIGVRYQAGNPGFHFDVNAIRRHRSTRDRTWVEVSLRCLYNRDNTATSTWVGLTGETGKSGTIMGEQVMRSHLTKMGKDGERWCDLRESNLFPLLPIELSLQGTFLMRLSLG